jgi:hypothetical protein
MNIELKTLLSSLQLMDAQTYKNITVFPLIHPGNGTPNYLTLGEAIGSSLLTVTEVSQAGSVPELKVINLATQPVLLIDGEELIGAKQNRVLNTSILLKETLEEAAQCEQSEFPSIGHGTDLRFKKQNLAGAALVHGGCVVHSAFFRLPSEPELSKMVSVRKRRQRFSE